METTKTSLLYALEVSKDMHAPDRDGSSNLTMALDAICEYLRVIMTSEPTTQFGVLFYGVKGHEMCVYPFLNLQQQDSSGVKKLQRLTEMSAEELEAELVPATYNLSDVFYACGQEMERHNDKSWRKLVLVTSCDKPNGYDNTRLSMAAETRCQDLVEKGVHIEPIFISSPTQPFEIDVFWDRLKYSQADTTLYTTSSPQDSIKANIMSRSNTKRSIFGCNLLVKDTIIANIKGYNLYMTRKAPAPRQVYIQGDKQVEPETKTVNIVQNTGKEIPTADVKRAFKFGGRWLPPMTQEQLDQLKDFGEPKINIVGTVDKDSFKFIGHTKHSVFIYPYEGTHEGSVRGFTALWQSLLKKQKYAIATAILRKNSNPCTCVVVPSEAEFYSDQPTVQRSPSGLHLVFLPYIDDLRRVPDPRLDNDIDESSEEARAIFRRIMEKLTMKNGYNPGRYHNPSLAWLDEVIEATALSMPMPAQFVDETKPKYNSIQKRAGADIAAFNAVIKESQSKRRDTTKKS